MSEEQMETDGPFVMDDGGVFIAYEGKWQRGKIRIPPGMALTLACRVIARHEELNATGETRTSHVDQNAPVAVSATPGLPLDSGQSKEAHDE
jgi:hypothetical protein